MEQIRILILEDNTADADLILRYLKRSGMVFISETVETRKSFEQALDAFRQDIVLSDYSLPAFDAVAAFGILCGRNPGVPFIIVSGTVGEENVVKLIKDGVTDFASKDNLSGLSQKVGRALHEAGERREKMAILEKLQTQAAALLAANSALLFQNAEKDRRTAELVSANAELLAFNYISSHDLQEPLRKIETFASRIMEGEMHNMTDAGKRSMERIQASATRMRRLITDLLSFSRVSSTDRAYEMTDLHLILEEVAADLKDTIAAKSATIEASGLLQVNTVAFQFRQLLYNLVSNSLKFSSPLLAPVIKVRTRILPKGHPKLLFLGAAREKDYWNLTFEDNGIGFDAAFSELIFVMFKRLHDDQEYSGTGIGLAIVKKIVDNHNGFITATGKKGTGASFEIYIPMPEEDSQHDSTLAQGQMPVLN